MENMFAFVTLGVMLLCFAYTMACSIMVSSNMWRVPCFASFIRTVPRKDAFPLAQCKVLPFAFNSFCDPPTWPHVFCSSLANSAGAAPWGLQRRGLGFWCFVHPGQILGFCQGPSTQTFLFARESLSTQAERCRCFLHTHWGFSGRFHVNPRRSRSPWS